MDKHETFKPDWLSSPGDTIREFLDETERTIEDLTASIGKTKSFSEQLLCGKEAITPTLAEKLSSTIGGSAAFWINLDSNYRSQLEVIQHECSTTQGTEWLRELPANDMKKFGWLEPAASRSETVFECLQFFGVSSIDSWREKYKNLLEKAAFRTSPAFHSQVGAVAAWIRQGEIESDSIECSAWNPDRFRNELTGVRELTRLRNPSEFIPKLRQRCAECGVAVAVVRAPTKCRASGVTTFLSTNRPLLLLSFRHLTDDHFWFTFFHEAGHLLLHGNKGMFLDCEETLMSQQEKEANEFAANILVPAHRRESLLNLPKDGREIIRFARTLGISPGIVVGQLQNANLLRRNQFNNLKRRFTWD